MFLLVSSRTIPLTALRWYPGSLANPKSPTAHIQEEIPRLHLPSPLTPVGATAQDQLCLVFHLATSLLSPIEGFNSISHSGKYPVLFHSLHNNIYLRFKVSLSHFSHQILTFFTQFSLQKCHLVSLIKTSFEFYTKNKAWTADNITHLPCTTESSDTVLWELTNRVIRHFMSENQLKTGW